MLFIAQEQVQNGKLSVRKAVKITEGKRWYASIEKKDKAKITVILSFGTSGFYQQVFKEIWTGWSMGKYT